MDVLDAPDSAPSDTKVLQLEQQVKDLQAQLALVSEHLALSEQKREVTRRNSFDNSSTAQPKVKRHKKEEKKIRNSPIMTRRKSIELFDTDASTVKSQTSLSPALTTEQVAAMQLPLTRRYALPHQHYCNSIVDKLIKHRLSWPFRSPVDPTQWGAVDYFEVIKHPMDLGTVQTKMTIGDYMSIEDFATDVRLVFTNSMTYNPPENQIHQMAKSLLQMFEKKFTKLKQAVESNQEVLPVSPPEEGEEANVDAMLMEESSQGSEDFQKNVQLRSDLESSIGALQTTLTTMRSDLGTLRQREVDRIIQESATSPSRSPSPGTPSPEGGRKRGRPRKPSTVTYEEKKALSENMNDLTAEDLLTVIRIIETSMPSLATDPNESMEIDLDILNESTLRRLQQFVNASKRRYAKALELKKKEAEVSQGTPPLMVEEIKLQTPPKRRSSPTMQLFNSEEQEEAEQAESESESDSEPGSKYLNFGQPRTSMAPTAYSETREFSSST